MSKYPNIALATTIVTYQEKESRLEPSRYSSWIRLTRVTAWVYRFISNCRLHKEQRYNGELQSEEFEDAEVHIIHRMQRIVFKEEYLLISSGKKLPNNSKLLYLNPVIDEDGLIRSNGRLEYANYLSFETKHPIILPPKNWVTQLIVKMHHEKVRHFGTNQTLSSLSTKYWILQGREEIREWEKECQMCRRKKAKVANQIMAPLPKIRLKMPLHAFARTAVDFAGPFYTVQGRGKRRAKRYLCLFTCLLSRAVHLEMAYGLDTDAFLNAFYRMTNRRGLPKEIISDNGTNFVGGNRELKELVEQLNENKIKTSTADKGVKWHFNPPLAPHFGGIHETMIKSVKRSIYAILENADCTDEELLTAFTGAETLINSRPITYQTANPEDNIPLTPNHFLHGQMGGEFAASTVDTTEFSPRKRWRRIQELVKHFWKRWMREWLPYLNPRKKWFHQRESIKIGDIVLVIHPNTPGESGQWDEC